MVVFGIELFHDKISNKFIDQTKRRLKSNDILKNPFKGNIKYRYNNIIIEMTPIYPNITLLALFIIVPIILFGWSYWLLLFSFPFLLVGFFRSKYGMFVGFYIGLRKQGYEHRIRLLKDQELIKVLL